MSTAYEGYQQRMADPVYAAHIQRIVADMPEPTELRTRTVQGLVAAGRREAALAAAEHRKTA